MWGSERKRWLDWRGPFENRKGGGEVLKGNIFFCPHQKIAWEYKHMKSLEWKSLKLNCLLQGNFHEDKHGSLGANDPTKEGRSIDQGLSKCYF